MHGGPHLAQCATVAAFTGSLISNQIKVYVIILSKIQPIVFPSKTADLTVNDLPGDETDRPDGFSVEQLCGCRNLHQHPPPGEFAQFGVGS